MNIFIGIIVLAVTITIGYGILIAKGWVDVDKPW